MKDQVFYLVFFIDIYQVLIFGKLFARTEDVNH